MTTHKIYVDGRVRICVEMCRTCVFRPGNLMSLSPGRLAGMVRDATRDDSTIVCHETLDRRLQAACRGFVDRHPTQPLQIAVRLGLVTDVDTNDPLEDPPPSLRRLWLRLEGNSGDV